MGLREDIREMNALFSGADDQTVDELALLRRVAVAVREAVNLIPDELERVEEFDLDIMRARGLLVDALKALAEWEVDTDERSV